MLKANDQIRAQIKAQIQNRFKKMAALTGVMLIAAAEALAQENSSRPARRIVVSIPDRKLAVLEGDRIVRIFQTAVGAPHTPSPTGVYQIVNTIADPTLYTKGKIVPPGKCNPLGTRWLGLSRKGYGIHGTNRPSSIGRNASHGCIRMRNREVEELFKMVAVGEKVELYDERNPEIARLFGAPSPTVAAGEPADQ
jgi:lipoprotein-anchoring transpeptidase ErfK/SrfK